jgi:hypothetical protein
MDSFFASVELLNYPELSDKPVAVCGNPENRHGIILAKNTPAKKYKIKTAETVWQALKKCPDLILLPPHHEKYKEYSIKINEIYQLAYRHNAKIGEKKSLLLRVIDENKNQVMVFTTEFSVSDEFKNEVKMLLVG